MGPSRSNYLNAAIYDTASGFQISINAVMCTLNNLHQGK